VAGYLYEPGDADELVAHVRRLVRQPLLRARMARAARLSVRDRTWQAVNELLVSHYRDVSAPAVSRRQAG
jgi:phosphatidylinositol alpha 1,6-mannosyltransferase